MEPALADTNNKSRLRIGRLPPAPTFSANEEFPMRTMCFQTAAAVVATILISLPASADTKEKITKTVTPDGLVVTWRIDHPNVSRPVSHYKQIRFAEGDTVTI